MTATVTCPRCGIRLPAGRLPVCPRCLLETELPPAVLNGALQLIEEVGRGGMGTVWKARHLRLGRLVAVKFLPETGPPELAARLEREAQVLARLSHPGIVAVHDAGQEDGRPYIVMEYVEGRRLSDLLPLPPDRARQVGIELLDALAYAHDQGIVHRDVKPQNILVDPSGRVKVSDFGIARLVGAVEADSGLTGTGRLVGTPGYIAPEALAGATPDARMDVFAAGVVLHEMVTGHRPAPRVEALPPPFDRVVARACATDPDARYPSAATMAEELASDGQPAIRAAARADDKHWLRVVALVHTLATASVLWALLRSVTPRVLPSGGLEPLIMLGAEALPDGRVVSRARFETWPVLGAVAMLALATATQGVLRRYWREAGLDRPEPHARLPESNLVLGLGAVSLALYLARRLLAPQAGFWSSYVPIVGGALELAVVFVLWTAVLHSWRISRPLRREIRLWLGLGLALVPPTVDLAVYVASWQP